MANEFEKAKAEAAKIGGVLAWSAAQGYHVITQAQAVVGEYGAYVAPPPAEAPKAAPAPSEVKVIGTSPTTGEVLVKTDTGEMYWKPGTPEQIEQVTKEIERLPETPEAKLPSIPYTPPEGVGYEQPSPGSPAKPIEEGKPVEVYSYRGDIVTLSQKQAEELRELAQQASLHSSRLPAYVEKAVELGVLQKGTKATQEGIIPGWAVEAQERYERDHVIIGDKAMPIKEWNELPENLQSIAIKGGFDAMERAVREAEAILAPFKEKDGYRIDKALLTRDPEIERAVDILFGPEVVKQIRYEKATGLTIGKPAKEVAEEAATIKDKIASTLEKKGITVPPFMLGAVAVAVIEPTPIGEIVVLAALGAYTAYSTRKAIVSARQMQQAREIAKEFEQNTGRQITADDIILISPNGTAIPLSKITELPSTIQEKLKIPALTPPQLQPWQESMKTVPEELKKTGEWLVPPVIEYGQESVKALERDWQEGLLINYPRPMVYIPGIGAVPKEMTQAERMAHGQPNAEDLYLKQVANAEKGLVKTINKTTLRVATQTFPMTREEFNSYLMGLIAARTLKAKEASKVNWREVEEALARGKEHEKATEIVRKARENEEKIERLTAKALTELEGMAAYTRYVRAVGNYRIATMSPKYGGVTKTQLAIINAYDIAHKAAASTYGNTKSLAKAETAAMANAKAHLMQWAQTQPWATTVSSTALQNATQTVAKTAAQTATRALTQTAVYTATRTATPALTRPLTRTAARTIARTVTGPARLRLPKAKVDREKRGKLEAFAGAIGWKQGFVIYAIKEPYQSKDDLATFSAKNPPPNMKLVAGPRSAYRTIQTLTGRPPAALDIDMGIMDVKIRQPAASPGQAGTIGFKRDIKQQTRGDITLGKETYRRGNVRIVESGPEVALTRHNQRRTTLSRRKARKSKEIDLGVGIVRNKKRQHIKLR